MSSQTEVRPVLLGGRLRLALRVILSISVSLFGLAYNSLQTLLKP